MANRLLKTASITFIPGVPGVPSTPDRWVTREEYIALGKPAGSTYGGGLSLSGGAGGIGSGANAAVIGQIISGAFGNGPTVGGPGGSEWGQVKETRVLIKGTPAIPATPAKFSRLPQNGWNGGARSIRRVIADGQVKFQLGPRDIGALVGLSGPVDSQNFGEATHAFYLTGGVVSVVERGVQVAAVGALDLSVRPVFTITRQKGVVTYTVEAFSYTSLIASMGDVYLDALLYTADDYVENPILNTFQRGAATGQLQLVGSIDLRPRASGELRLDGGAVMRAEGVALSAARGPLRLTGSSKGGTQNSGAASGGLNLEGEVLAPASRSVVRRVAGRVISSETAYARSVALFGGATVISSGGAPIIFTASSVAAHGSPQTKSVGITGGVGSSTATLRGEAYSVDQLLTPEGVNWGKSEAVSEGHYFVLSGSDPYGPEEFVVNEALLLAESYDVGNWQNLSVDEWLELDVEADFVVMVDAEISELLILSDSASVLHDIDLAIAEALYISDSSTNRSDGGLQVAVNMVTSASSFYRGFDYLSILSNDSVAYGVKPDGVYRLGVGLGGKMDAEIDFGAAEFGRATSRVQEVFIGCSADGEVYVKLTPDDGVEHTYRAIQRQPVMRADPAMGLTGRKWRLCLQLVEVTAAQVDMIEFISAESRRRGVH